MGGGHTMCIEDIRKSIEDECVSYDEIAWLQEHQDEVLKTGDPVLCEWAGIPEEKYREEVSK